MKKIDGKGHHPKVRPYHRRFDKDLKEVRISVCSSLSAWQLAMKRLGICFTASEKNGIGTPSFAGLSLCEAVEQASSATQPVGVGCTDAGGWYVDTSGCGMLQYDDANPPPKNEFTHSVLKVLAILLSLVLVVVASSCNKTPEPTPKPEPTPTDTIPPVTPNDTIPPVTPNDTIVPTPGIDTIPPAPGGDTIVPTPPTGGKIANFYYDGGVKLPPLDSIRKYANDPEYDTIYIKWCVETQDYWTPGGFHSARDSLNKRFNISPKVYGAWILVPYQILPDSDSTNIGLKGMIERDRDWYESKHYTVMPIIGDKNTKKPQQAPRYDGTMVMPRNNCRGGRVRGR